MQILRDFQLEGGHTVNKTGAGITIVRQDQITPRRITYTPSEGKLVIEKQEFRGEPFLERFHVRRGYQSPYKIDDAWAVSVDVTMAGVFFWMVSQGDAGLLQTSPSGALLGVDRPGRRRHFVSDFPGQLVISFRSCSRPGSPSLGS